jgi:hypothetical protein
VRSAFFNPFVVHVVSTEPLAVQQGDAAKKKQLREELDGKTVDDLKTMLKFAVGFFFLLFRSEVLISVTRANDQLYGGKRDELVDRVVDCKMNGCLPRCPTCFGYNPPLASLEQTTDT